MNSREILEYSRQLVSAKSEIETAQQAEPDLEDQVKTKFREDSVNRARFIDATLLIGAATKEFRNVFGVDAPHYELSDNCYLAIDRNGDGRYFSTFDKKTNLPIFDEEDKPIYVIDPMSGNEETDHYLDCWELANAARFDSNMRCSNYFGDDDIKSFADKQKFFVDKKKAEESSAAHNPICPPGYDKWAGNKIYSCICKVFDLDEINLFRLLGNKNIQTIASQFEIKANGDDKFECNINEDGIITKNIYDYSYSNDDALIYASNHSALLPEAGCTASDLAPIKWYKYRVPDNVTRVGDKWCHKLRLENSPFANSDLSLVSFELFDTSTAGMMKTFLQNLKNKEEPSLSFNDGYAILARNPNQALPSESMRGLGYYDIEYSVNIIWRRNTGEGNLDRGDTETEVRDKKFLFWKVGEKTVVKKKPYKIVFSPVNKRTATTFPWATPTQQDNNLLPEKAMVNLSRFIYRMEEESLNYYKWIIERKLNVSLPNQEAAIRTITTLRDAAYNCYVSPGKDNWAAMLTALRNRVAFDLLERENVSDAELNRVTNFGKAYRYTATGQYSGSKSFISAWKSNWIPNWPRWLRRLLKRWSTPVYENHERYTLNLEESETSFLYSRIETQLVLQQVFLGPSSGDLTRSRGAMLTPGQLFTLLTPTQRKALVNAGIIRSRFIFTGMVIDGHRLDNNTRYEFVINQKYTKAPCYDEIKRASTINAFLKDNETIYFDAFTTLSDRINKRTGTLRKTYSLLESTNINAQMIAQKERNLTHLFKYMNAYEITGGFGTNVATIKLAAWEPTTSAYANLPRLSTVYLLADNTTLDKNRENFDQNWKKVIITDVIDKMSDMIFSYTLTKDLVVNENKTYYIYNDDIGQYVVAEGEAKTTENIANLYEQNPYATAGATFKVALSDTIPDSLRNRNPRLVKIY